jgi:hypothetical protein
LGVNGRPIRACAEPMPKTIHPQRHRTSPCRAAALSERRRAEAIAANRNKTRPRGQTAPSSDARALRIVNDFGPSR